MYASKKREKNFPEKKFPEDSLPEDSLPEDSFPTTETECSNHRTLLGRNKEIGAHVRSNLCFLFCVRH